MIRFYYILFLLINLWSCKNVVNNKASNNYRPDSYVLKSSTAVVADQIYADNRPFSGIVYQLDPVTSDTISKEEILNGYKHGVSEKWYSAGKLQESRKYAKGRKHGKQIAFWENGYKRFEYMAEDDAYHGELKEWNKDGMLLHLAHYKNGQE